jgi:hypothetical protein
MKFTTLFTIQNDFVPLEMIPMHVEAVDPLAENPFHADRFDNHLLVIGETQHHVADLVLPEFLFHVAIHL